MLTLILGVTVLALCALVGWVEYNARQERAKLINAIVSKSAEEMVQLEFSDKTKIIAEKPSVPDLVPLEQVTDEEFMEVIGK